MPFAWRHSSNIILYCCTIDLDLPNFASNSAFWKICREIWGKFIVRTTVAHQTTLWWSLLRFLERGLTPTWRAITWQLIQKEFWVIFSRIQLLINMSRLAVCLRQGPASSCYPSYQRRLGTECDSASLGELSRQAWQVTSHPKSPKTTWNEAARWHFNFTFNM